MHQKAGNTLVVDIKMETLLLDGVNPAIASRDIALAASILTEGGLVAFPTETVYGLGGNGLNANVVGKIFAAKGRPMDNPLILHIAEAAQMELLAQNIPPQAYHLANEFWPGPLTLVLEKKEIVPPEATGGLDSVAVRIPAHPVALALLRTVRLPIAAPSANLSGRPSPTTAQHVFADLQGKIDAILDGGASDVGVESTVLDIRGGNPLVLRPGGITPAQIAEALGVPVCPVAHWSEHSEDIAPPSPGMKYTHYAPAAPFYLITGNPEAMAAKLQELSNTFRADGKVVGLLLSVELAGRVDGDVTEVLGSRDNPAQLTGNLYAALRRFDGRTVDVILAEGYADCGIGLALMNRMVKAAGPRVLHVE